MHLSLTGQETTGNRKHAGLRVSTVRLSSHLIDFWILSRSLECLAAHEQWWSTEREPKAFVRRFEKTTLRLPGSPSCYHSNGLLLWDQKPSECICELLWLWDLYHSNRKITGTSLEKCIRIQILFGWGDPELDRVHIAQRETLGLLGLKRTCFARGTAVNYWNRMGGDGLHLQNMADMVSPILCSLPWLPVALSHQRVKSVSPESEFWIWPFLGLLHTVEHGSNYVGPV